MNFIALNCTSPYRFDFGIPNTDHSEENIASEPMSWEIFWYLIMLALVKPR